MSTVETNVYCALCSERVVEGDNHLVCSKCNIAYCADCVDSGRTICTSCGQNMANSSYTGQESATSAKQKSPTYQTPINPDTAAENNDPGPAKSTTQTKSVQSVFMPQPTKRLAAKIVFSLTCFAIIILPTVLSARVIDFIQTQNRIAQAEQVKNSQINDYIVAMDGLVLKSEKMDSHLQAIATKKINPNLNKKKLYEVERECRITYNNSLSLQDSFNQLTPPSQFSQPHSLFSTLLKELVIRARSLLDGVHAYNKGKDFMPSFKKGHVANEKWKRLKPEFDSAYGNAK